MFFYYWFLLRLFHFWYLKRKIMTRQEHQWIILKTLKIIKGLFSTWILFEFFHSTNNHKKCWKSWKKNMTTTAITSLKIEIRWVSQVYQKNLLLFRLLKSYFLMSKKLISKNFQYFFFSSKKMIIFSLYFSTLITSYTPIYSRNLLSAMLSKRGEETTTMKRKNKKI